MLNEDERRLSPCGRAFADQACVPPLEPVRRSLDPDRAVRGPLLSGADGDEAAVDLDDGWVVDAHITGHLRLRLGRPQGRREEKDERQEAKRRARSFSPNSAHG